MLIRLSIILIYLFSAQIASSNSFISYEKKNICSQEKQENTNKCLIHCVLDGIYETDSTHEKLINYNTFPYLKKTFKYKQFFFLIKVQPVANSPPEIHT